MHIENFSTKKMELKDKYVVLEYDGSVSVYDGTEYVEDLKEAPKDLKVEDGSFRQFVEAEAKKHQLNVEPQIEWPHCFRLT